MLGVTIEAARIVTGVAGGAVLGIVSYAVVSLLTRLLAAEGYGEGVTARYRIALMLGLLYGLVVIGLVALIASPVRPNVLWMVPTALGVFVISYVLGPPGQGVSAPVDEPLYTPPRSELAT